MAKVRAALNPNKPVDKPGNYRPISLLCIPCKLYECLIYNRNKLVIKTVLPEEQAGFRPNRCTLDQAALLTEDTEASFDKKLKAGIVFVNLSVAYNIVWHRGLTLKLLKTIPSKEMVRAIMGMISQCRFHVHIGKSESHCPTLLNGVPQGSVIVSTLISMYTYDIPTTVPRNYIYAGGISTMARGKCFTVFELTLSDNLDKSRNYFYNWRLKLNTTKTFCSAFHLTNRLADYEWNITTMVHSIPFDKTLKYLGVTLDRTLSYHQHLLNTAAKVSKRRTYWSNVPATTGELTSQLCILLHLLYVLLLPIVESKPSSKKLDTSFNERLRLVSRCVKSTCTELLPILSGIEPMDIRRKKISWVSV